jgi:YD repeat-containing protein
VRSASSGFDNVGRKLTIDQPNTAAASQVFDAVGNVKSITNAGPGGASSVLTYTYDDSNRRTAEVRSDGTATTWTYDKSLQLVNEWRTNPSAAALGVMTFNHTYSYDPAGNRTLSAAADGTRATSTYDNANRLQQTVAWTPPSTVVTIAFGYDAVGHCKQVQEPAGYTYYAWDAAEAAKVTSIILHVGSCKGDIHHIACWRWTR